MLIILRLLWSPWYFNQLFTDKAFNFTCIASNRWKLYLSFPGKENLHFFLHPSINPWCFSSTPFFYLSPCVALLYPLRCLASTFSPTNSVVFFTIHSAFKLENWGLGFMHRYLIAQFSVFENLIFIMVVHKNVCILCFNRMRWRKALWFLRISWNLVLWLIRGDRLAYVYLRFPKTEC